MDVVGSALNGHRPCLNADASGVVGIRYWVIISAGVSQTGMGGTIACLCHAYVLDIPNAYQGANSKYRKFGGCYISRTSFDVAAGLEVYKEYPVAGCGLHCLLRVRTNYPEHEKIFGDYRTLHSNIVQLAVDVGTIGVLAWLFLWLSFFMKVYSMVLGRRLNSDDDPPDRWVALASLSAVIAFLIGSLFETNFYDSEVVILTYFLMEPHSSIMVRLVWKPAPPTGHIFHELFF